MSSLDQLGITRAALWVGHGLGAVLALRAAATHPERVRAVVAISPLLYRDSAAARRHLRQLTPLELGGPFDRNLAKAIYGGPGVRPRLAGQLARLWRVDLPGAEPSPQLAPTSTAYRETLDNCVLRADGWRWFDQITAPVHMVLPAKDPVPDTQLRAGGAASECQPLGAAIRGPPTTADSPGRVSGGHRPISPRAGARLRQPGWAQGWRGPPRSTRGLVVRSRASQLSDPS